MVSWEGYKPSRCLCLLGDSSKSSMSSELALLDAVSTMSMLGTTPACMAAGEQMPYELLLTAAVVLAHVQIGAPADKVPREGAPYFELPKTGYLALEY